MSVVDWFPSMRLYIKPKISWPVFPWKPSSQISVNSHDHFYYCNDKSNSLLSIWAITAAMQSESLTQNDELTDQMTVSAKISQSICHPGETETHPSSHDTWFIYRSQSTWFPQENVFICFGVMDRTHCWMQMTAKLIKVPEVSLFLWVFCLNLGTS